MDRQVIDRVRMNRRLLASRWTAQVAETPGVSPWWLDQARADRLMLAGIEALGNALAEERVEPFDEFAARLSHEAFALQAPLHEVIRVILQLKPIVLEVLVEPAQASHPDMAALELLDRMISAGILEAVRWYERQRQRRTMATQEQVEALRDRLRRQVIVDPLTGLYNANHFPVAVRREVRRSRRFERVFTLALVALDQDDAIREAGGDEGLREVILRLSEILTRATRQVDVRAALGGTRFGLILPETPLDGAVAVAERIRGAIESASFEFPEHAHHRTQTVSIGLACFPQDAQDDAGLLTRLEEALTRARAERSTTVATLSTQHS